MTDKSEIEVGVSIRDIGVAIVGLCPGSSSSCQCCQIGREIWPNLATPKQFYFRVQQILEWLIKELLKSYLIQRKAIC